MKFRTEARLFCAIMMLGMALSTLSSLTGINLSGRGDVGTTLLVGALVLGMVFATGPVLVGCRAWASLAAAGTGAAAAVTGWLIQVRPFLWQYPAGYTAFALASLAFAARPERREWDPPKVAARGENGSA